MAKPEWGLKRTCRDCGKRFYDFGRDPIVCPGCQAVFDPLAMLRPRRSRPPAAAAPAARAAGDEAVIDTGDDDAMIKDEADLDDDDDGVPGVIDDDEC